MSERRQVWARIEGEPVPKDRPRFSPRNGKAYTAARTTAAEGVVRWEVKAQNGALLGEPPWFPKGQEVAVTLTFASKRRLDDTVGVCDLDNLTKLVLDALNGLVWADDRQVSIIDAGIDRGQESAYTVIRVDPIG